MAVFRRRPPLLEDSSDGQVSDHEHDHLRQRSLVRLGSRGHLDGSVRLQLQRTLSERVWWADTASGCREQTSHHKLVSAGCWDSWKANLCGICGFWLLSILLALGSRLAGASVARRRWKWACEHALVRRHSKDMDAEVLGCETTRDLRHGHSQPARISSELFWTTKNR